MGRQEGLVFPFDDLPHTAQSHELVGADHGDVPFSVILVHASPGAGPRLHRHPYPEVFIVESGRATFRLDEDEIVVEGGHVVVGPSNVPHGFTNTGTGELRLIAIHGAPAFDTEWLAGVDMAWASRRHR
ncbi:MAG: cupin domain-containing protein [Chloroflexi bacterium]|nr:MAG: cupin domain-containing protein [Chloroflexota bacterium]